MKNYLEIAANYYREVFEPLEIGDSTFTEEEFIEFRINELKRDVVQETKDWEMIKDFVSNKDNGEKEIKGVLEAEDTLISIIEDDRIAFDGHVTGGGW